MKLRKVLIENFRSIKRLEFEFPKNGMLVLVGPNNSGKSNIIRAIDGICGDGWFGPEKMEDHDYYLRNKDNQVEIRLYFDNGKTAKLSSSEKWPAYLDHSNRKIYGKVGDDYPCTYLGADRTFDRHLAFYDWTLIGKIRKAFHQRATVVQSELKAKFNELTKIFDKVEGFTKFKSDFSRFFDEMQADTPARLSIDFKPFTPANYFKTMQILAADPNQGEDVLDLSELGEGSRNTILLALLRSYAVNFRNSPEGVSGILALEEPEIFLHPQARRHLFKVLREISESGMQVIISTHSSSFIDTEFFESIGQVVKEPDDENPGKMHTTLTIVSKNRLVEHCRTSGVPVQKVTKENVTEFYKTTSNFRLNEGFFARFLVLVEGETEELALPEYLSAVGLDCDLRGVSIISVQGKNQIPKYWRLFCLYKTPLLVVFDNDSDSPEKQKSNKNLASCFALTLDEIVNEVDIFKVIESKNSPNTPIIIMEKDFETALSKDFCKNFPTKKQELEKWEQEAKDLIKPIGNQNKGQIARYIARKIRSTYPDYTPSFIKEIGDRMKIQLGLERNAYEPEEDMPF